MQYPNLEFLNEEIKARLTDGEWAYLHERGRRCPACGLTWSLNKDRPDWMTCIACSTSGTQLPRPQDKAETIAWYLAGRVLRMPGNVYTWQDDPERLSPRA